MLRETKLRQHHVRLGEKLQFRGMPCDASRAILHAVWSLAISR